MRKEKGIPAPVGGWVRASGYEIRQGILNGPPAYLRYIMQTPQAIVTPYRFDEVIKRAPHTLLLGLFPHGGLEPSDLYEYPAIMSKRKYELTCKHVVKFAKEFGFLGIPFAPVEAYVFDANGSITGVMLQGQEEPQNAADHFRYYNPLLTPPTPSKWGFEALLSTYTEPLKDWGNTISELRFLMDHIYRAQHGEPANVTRGGPQESAYPWVSNELNERLQHMPPMISWREGKGFVSVINAGCLHDFLYFMVYKDLIEGTPVVKCRRCGQPFFKHYKREFCGDLCANAYSQAEDRKRRKNPRQSMTEEP